MSKPLALELKGITKVFGSIVANKDVDLQVKRGEILAILGENGSGKTTLMNMVSGIYFPDEGQIFVDGEEVFIRSPKDAFDHKIGMIHQHFKLVDVFTATENIVLGINDGEKFNLKKAQERVKEITDRYGFQIDLNKIYRGADILILDEPTAVLTPQETQKLFVVLRNMRADNKTVVIITHKLHEVLAISDRVTILRKGKYIDTVLTSEATEQSLTEGMVGEKVALNIERKDPENPQERLVIKDLNVSSYDGKKLLNNISFTAYGGEILGIAGISGSGQKELLESVAGLQKADKGSSIVYFDPEGKEIQLVGKTPKAIRNLGIALSFVPEDRLGMGLVGNMDIIDNMMLRSYKKGKTEFLDRKQPKALAEEIIDELHVRGEEKPRTYRKKAHKDYTSYARSRKPKAKQTRKAISKQLGYLKRNIGSIEKMLADGKRLSTKFREKFSTIKIVFAQQKEMYVNHTHSVKDRIVSLSQPWIRPIVRGKAKAKVEFGVKLDISVCDGWTRLERHSFDAYNESTGLQDMIEQYRKRTGHYPERVLADKIYRNRDNLNFCKQHNIRLSGPALGRPKKDAEIDKKQNYIDECERVEVERKFSLAKRKCGMGMIVTRLKETTCHCVAMSVLLLNLRKIEKLRAEILLFFMRGLKLAFVQ